MYWRRPPVLASSNIYILSYSHHFILSHKNSIRAQNVKCQIVLIAGTASPIIILGFGAIAKVTFRVMEHLGTELVLCRNFCNSYIQIIFTQQYIFRPTKKSPAPIFKEAYKLWKHLSLVPRGQNETTFTGSVSLIIWIGRPVAFSF